jgi:hypothetical protein
MGTRNMLVPSRKRFRGSVTVDSAAADVLRTDVDRRRLNYLFETKCLIANLRRSLLG